MARMCVANYFLASGAAAMQTLQDTTDSPTPLFDVRQVAELLRCSVRHVDRLVDAGKLPQPVKLGALVRWSKATIEDWIAAGCPAVRSTTRPGGR